jgi:prophage maintenance system killer protein
MSTHANKSSRSAPLSAGPVSIKVFSSDRILEIHQALVSYFAKAIEPIRDLGLRDASLLEQAVSHQFSGADGGSHPLEKPAALLQGLFDELPFHDGNAQTAFLALLLLLDENGYIPNRVSFETFFEFCAAISEHRLEPEKPQGKPGRQRSPLGPASELVLILRWLEEHTKPEQVRDHPLALPELRRLLAAQGFELVEDKTGTEQILELFRSGGEGKKGLFGLGGGRKQAASGALHRLAAPGEGALVSLTAVRDLRKVCGLEPGLFYDWRARVDSLIRQYQTLLVRLARL